MTETNLVLELPGELGLSERGEENQDTGRASTTLLDDVEGDIELRVYLEESRDRLSVELSRYHVENPETKRVFHSRLEVFLNYEQAKMLLGYLKFIMKHVELEPGKP